ncbi:hypothetical protein ACFY2W_08315 [Streptomyces sp. NPDC001262]|uniref:hypothetical protein n=1 Tax=Streptomyces sp. NPDC001262 TaxID=3364552 RepID=UPI0036BC2F48
MSKAKRGCGGCAIAAVVVFAGLVVLGAIEDGGKGGAPNLTKSSPAPASPAMPVPQQLRDLDVAAGVHAGLEGAYDSAFKALSSRCMEQDVRLGNVVGAVLGLLQKGGVRDENRLTVMQHLTDSIPAGSRMGCADVGAVYVTLRTGH